MEKEVWSKIPCTAIRKFLATFCAPELSRPELSRIVLTNFSRFVGLSNLQKNYMSYKIEKKLNIQVKEFEQSKFLQSHDGPILIIHDKRDKQVSFSEAEEYARALKFGII